MPVTRSLKSILIAALLLSGAANAAGNMIVVGAEDGRTIAQFTLGDSNCVLKDDQIQCTPRGR
jgi:DNA repair ATPase RecN